MLPALFAIFKTANLLQVFLQLSSLVSRLLKLGAEVEVEDVEELDAVAVPPGLLHLKTRSLPM